MAPLSLKVVQDEGAVTRTVKFESKSKVSTALATVKEKILTGDDGKEYGLFLTSADDDLSGIWLEDHRNLEYYMLRDGDTLHYLCKRRNLKVRMLDGSVKTLLIDESKPVEQLMMHICARIGITNHDEYGLCPDDDVEEEEKPMPATGTLTLRRVKQEKEKDVMLEQLSKKLKTDDNVQWLDKHKTLREQGVGPRQRLLLKRRLFYSDRNVDARDPVQLNLLYLQARDAILNGKHPVTEDKAADCKVRWINIRDVNRRIIRKSLQNPGPHNRLYKYESQLSFMRPFYRDILIQNTEFESDDKSDKDWNTEECDQQMNCSNESDDSDYSIKKTKNKVSKGSKKKKKRSYEQEEKPATSNFSETTMTSDFDPSDPVDAFLLSIGATLKTFSPYHLNLAKSKIFTVVQEHDLQQIVQKSNDVKVSTSDTMYLP